MLLKCEIFDVFDLKILVNSFHIATTMTIQMIPMIFTLKTRITNGRYIIDYN